MKKNFKQCKTKFLLFFLLALFAGGLSPAWAQVTESFEDVTLVDADTWGRAGKFSNGWVCVGSTGTINNAGLHATSEDYPFYLYSNGKTGDKSLGGIASSTNNYYLVIPTLISGDVTYYCKGTASTYGYLRFYKVTDNGDDTYTIGSQIGSVVSKNSSSGWVSGNVSVGDDETMIAIKLNRMAIDDITYTPYVEAGCKKPKDLTISNVTFESADLSWTEGEEGQDAWQVVYSTESNFDKDAATPIDVNTTSYSFTELKDNTTYYVAVRTYCGAEDQSGWITTSFTTAKVAVPATGFTDDFETNKGWDFVNGTLTNAWVRGAATNNGGTSAMYISNDGGTSNAYSISGNTMVYAAKYFAFGAGDYTISYDWKANGESGWDFMRVLLVPSSVELAAGTALPSGLTKNTVPSGWQALDGGSELSGSSSWANKSVDINIAEAANYYVVFAWRNDGSGGSQPAAAIDNFKIIGSAPVLELGGDVVGTALAFGSVSETTNKSIRITNSGKVAMENITLTETADADNVFAYAELPKTTLAANEYMDVQVTFSGSSAKDYTGTFRVAADDCDPIDVTVTATYSNSAATMAVTLGEEAVGASVAFGNVGKQATKTFTVTNDGDQTLNVTSITSSNATDFTVSPASLEIAGHTSETFTVTFVYPSENPVLNAEKTANITVTASNDDIDPVVFAVTGTRIEEWSEDFSGNSQPVGWEAESYTYYGTLYGWTFTNNVAKGIYRSNYSYYLTTPSLTVTGAEDALTFDYEATGNYVSIAIQMSKDGGDWKTCTTTPTIGSLSSGNSGTATITGLEAGNYKFRFKADNYNLDNFQGFKRNMNDPKLGIYSDAECTEAVATSVTKDFGFVTETQTATYYIKNDGTGTMTLSLGDAPAGLTQTLDNTSVAAGEHATLTITMPAANKGYNGGNVVVTAANLGTFTVAASGVIVDDTKMDLNFATATIPATWTTNSWSKNASGYAEVGYSSNPVTMQTSNLTAEAGEKLVVVAKQSYTSSSYSFGVKYKKTDAEEWSDLIAAANIGTNYVMLHGTIAEAGTYQLQFNGQYTQIQRIYGLSVPQEPVMVVYDGEELAAATYNFGNVSDEADATWTLTVKNEGKAALTGLAAALTGDNADHYSVQVSSTNVAVDASTTIIVKQLKDNVGSHSATLTISATGLDSKVITLSGFTYDHNKLFVDFDNPNAFPTGWTAGTSWSVYTYGNDRYAQQTNYSTSSALVTTPLTVGSKEVLTFQAGRYSNYSAGELKVRYTSDGGVTWSDYEDYSSQITSSNYVDIELNGIPEGTAIIEFYGRYVKLDNIYGFAPTTAPVLALTESAIAVADGDMKDFGNLTEDGVATYTLTNNGNGDLVSVVSTTGVATAVISGEGEGITLAKVNDSETYNKVTLAPGKSATITLTIPVGAPYGNQKGDMTIDSEGWVGDMYVNYTANTIDPTALYEDFAGNAKPAGWYQESSGWLFTQGTAHVYTGVEKEIITEQYEAEAASGKNVLSFDAKLQSTYADGELKVYTSSDRKTWTLRKTVALTEGIQAVALDALADGNYYVKFVSLNASIDNLAGLKKLSAPAHDLYVTATTFPATTLVPNTVAGVNASATVASLRADETDVYAKLFFDEEVVATAEPKAIDLNSTATFTLTGNVPETEKTYAAKIVVYYSDNSVAFETLTTNVEVAHTRTLAITEFTRTDGDGALDADENNQISPSFSVTVENTGSTAATPTVKIYQGGNVVATATAAAAIAAGATSDAIALTATNMSAGEGGVLEFTAKAFWTAEGEALATSASNVSINVNAAAPLFVLYQDATPVGNGDDVEFGLVKTGEIPTYSYTIKNEGTANMELVSIVAPTGFTATPAITDDNKNIAVNGTLAITVTMQAEQGKKNGDLVITYKVDAMTNNTFTLALSGRSIAADTWTEAFNNYEASIPANWTNTTKNGWSIAGEYNDYPGAIYSNNGAATLMTPRLAATEGEELTFDVVNNYYGTATYAYSTDKVNWSAETTITGTGEKSFVAPADGNYYIRFTGRGTYIQNFVGFRLNPLNLILDEASNNSFAAANYDKITLNRTFIAGWNTVCLPFAFIQESDIEEFFGEGAKVYYLSSHNGTEFFFDRASGMQAGYPYLVYVPMAITEPKVMHNVDITNTDTEAHYMDHTSNGSTIYFRGTYSPIAAGGWEKKVNTDKIYVLTPEAKIAKAGASATSKGFRGYFDTPATMEVKGIVFDDIETGIISIENGELTIENGAIYNLAGQRINRAQKGVNIVNGKKMLVK